MRWGLVLGVVAVVAFAGVAAAGTAPYVDAGLDQEVYVGDQVYLDGGGTWDDDGDITSKEWEIETPNGSVIQPDCPECWFTSFVVNQTGQYNATLTVRDSEGHERSDTLYVTVRPLEIDMLPPQTNVTSGGSSGGGGGGASEPDEESCEGTRYVFALGRSIEVTCDSNLTDYGGTNMVLDVGESENKFAFSGEWAAAMNGLAADVGSGFDNPFGDTGSDDSTDGNSGDGDSGGVVGGTEYDLENSSPNAHEWNDSDDDSSSGKDDDASSSNGGGCFAPCGEYS